MPRTRKRKNKKLKRANKASPPSPEFPCSPLPAIVVIIPSPDILRILWLVESATYKLYILDTNNNAIRVIDLATNIITKFIDNTYTPNPDLFQPQSFTFDSDKNFLYVANTFRNKIIKIDINTKAVSLVAGDGSADFLDNVIADKSKLNAPYGVALDNLNNVYIADTRNNRIRFISNMGKKIFTIAGNGFPGFFGDNASPLSSKVYNPTNLIVDLNYNVIFSDSGNNRIRKIFINGIPNSSSTVYPEVTSADMEQFYNNPFPAYYSRPWMGTPYWSYWRYPRTELQKKAWLTIAGNLPNYPLPNDPNNQGRRDVDEYKKAQDALDKLILNMYFFITTVGKLNFFRWAIEKGIIDYIKLNWKTIETEMNSSAKEIRKIRKDENKPTEINKSTDIKKRMTRRKATVSDNVPSKQMQKHFTSIEISFD